MSLSCTRVLRCVCQIHPHGNDFDGYCLQCYTTHPCRSQRSWCFDKLNILCKHLLNSALETATSILSQMRAASVSGHTRCRVEDLALLLALVGARQPLLGDVEDLRACASYECLPATLHACAHGFRDGMTSTHPRTCPPRFQCMRCYSAHELSPASMSRRLRGVSLKQAQVTCTQPELVASPSCDASGDSASGGNCAHYSSVPRSRQASAWHTSQRAGKQASLRTQDGVAPRCVGRRVDLKAGV